MTSRATSPCSGWRKAPGASHDDEADPLVRPGRGCVALGDLAEVFLLLSPHMAGPVNETSIWVKEVPGEIFTPGAFAPPPGARTSSASPRRCGLGH